MSVADPPRHPVVPRDPPVLAPGHTAASVTDKISSVVFGKMPVWFYAGMAVAFGGVMMLLLSLTKLNFDPHEGFVLSRVNGQWDVQSILKLCPMAEDDTLMIFAHLLERKVIELV